MLIEDKTLLKRTIFLFLLLSLPVEARMYQWLDPDSGTTQLSGKPPYWYRSTETGPRVFVFENGRIIDDTAVLLTDEHRNKMRQKAFAYVEEQQKLQQTKTQSDTELTEDSLEEELELAASDEADAAGESETDNSSQFMQMTMEQMRTLIQDWENTQTEKAREIIGN